MKNKVVFLFSLLVLFYGLVSSAIGLEKVKLGSAVKMVPEFYLPVSAAEEKGFWKENDLEVEWVPFAGTAAQAMAAAAGSISIGMSPPDGPMVPAERGVPVVLVAELVAMPFYLWVKADSPYRHPRDLKGLRVGVTTLGGTTHAFGRIIFKDHGIEKDVRFIGAGGVRENVAGFRAGAFEAMVTSLGAAVILKLEWGAREIASTADYLPKPWFDQSIFARKDFARSKPEVVRKLLKAVLQSVDFIRKNPRWAQDKMKSFQGLSEEAAKLVYDDYKWTVTGKLDRKAVENVRKVFIEYGILTQKAPAVDDLFTNDYLS